MTMTDAHIHSTRPAAAAFVVLVAAILAVQVAYGMSFH
jgi:hypothetical protein